jgi:hypothetical protein
VRWAALFTSLMVCGCGAQQGACTGPSLCVTQVQAGGCVADNAYCCSGQFICGPGVLAADAGTCAYSNTTTDTSQSAIPLANCR